MAERLSVAEMAVDYYDASGRTARPYPSADVPEEEAVERLQAFAPMFDEFFDAFGERDTVGIADGLARIVYEAHCMALTFGIPLDLVVDEVHRSYVDPAEGAVADVAAVLGYVGGVLTHEEAGVAHDLIYFLGENGGVAFQAARADPATFVASVSAHMGAQHLYAPYDTLVGAVEHDWWRLRQHGTYGWFAEPCAETDDGAFVGTTLVLFAVNEEPAREPTTA